MLSDKVKDETGKNLYTEVIEDYPTFLKLVAEELERLKAFSSGHINHEIINLQGCILSQVRELKEKAKNEQQ